ncbi:TetR/AcrR family transcriptional regulator [Streptomyces sp. NBC_00102]|uniref:TetR/AcrR family transcriptional regulator n=1 Tax=Streptomyces sp. NBC_00102 TaxID=2975652 RepID=UPI0022581575|nr:TetR family transcriptional regulator [Streptomyces sp. NBC_00102]MCX5400380.1 TetR family transcriptional regulator [Streptomyces sp. NBC_00102]
MQAKEPHSGADGVAEDRRRHRTLRTREALAAAAVDLLLERGPAELGVDTIAQRAQVTRRTFSRHFSGKEEAALWFTRADGLRINELLRVRPLQEPPLVAFRAAVLAWLEDPARAAWHSRPKERAVFALIDDEPALFAAYQRIRIDAQSDSVRVLAERMGVDPALDPLPGVVVSAGAGVLAGALHRWAADVEKGPEELGRRVREAFDLLIGEAVAAHRSEAGSGSGAGAGSGVRPQREAPYRDAPPRS